MKRSDWLSKPQHSAETTYTATKEYRVEIFDPHSRSATGWGKSEELAFTEAHETYKSAMHRASLTTRHAAGRAVRPV